MDGADLGDLGDLTGPIGLALSRPKESVKRSELATIGVILSSALRSLLLSKKPDAGPIVSKVL